MVRTGTQRGLILIHDGRVVYADTARLKGEAAFQEILSWKQGQIKEVKVKIFPVPNIHKDVQELLMNAGMLVDESIADGDTDHKIPARERVAALSDEPESESACAEVMPQGTAKGRVPAKGFVQRYIGMGALALGVLLIGLMFLF